MKSELIQQFSALRTALIRRVINVHTLSSTVFPLSLHCLPRQWGKKRGADLRNRRGHVLDVVDDLRSPVRVFRAADVGLDPERAWNRDGPLAF